MVPVCWGITNIIDKVIVDKYLKEPLLATIIMQFFGFFWMTVAAAFAGLEFLEAGQMAVYVVSSAVWLGGILLYFITLKHGEASRVITAFNIVPVFVLFFAAAFLGETITAAEISGVFLLVAGAMLVSIKKADRGYFRKWILFVVLAAVFFSADTVVTKNVIDEIGWFSALYWKMAIASALFLLFSPLYFRRFYAAIKKKPAVLGISAFNEVFGLSARGFLYYGFTLGPVSLIYAVSSLQPFIVLSLAITLTLLAPKILKEEIGAEQVALKLVAVILAVAGAILVSI